MSLKNEKNKGTNYEIEIYYFISILKRFYVILNNFKKIRFALYLHTTNWNRKLFNLCRVIIKLGSISI